MNSTRDEPRCQMTTDGEGEFDDSFYLCGRPAKWKDPDGRFYCGIHRRVVDRTLLLWVKKKCERIG